MTADRADGLALARYRHEVDTSRAPLDPDVTGLGRTTTDAQGRYQPTTTTTDDRALHRAPRHVSLRARAA